VKFTTRQNYVSTLIAMDPWVSDLDFYLRFVEFKEPEREQMKIAIRKIDAEFDA